MTVYFIQAGTGGPIKIGYCDDVRGRMMSMQSHNAAVLCLLATRDGVAAEERALHRQFASARIRGEWFGPTPELLAEIRQGGPFLDFCLGQTREKVARPNTIEHRRKAFIDNVGRHHMFCVIDTYRAYLHLSDGELSRLFGLHQSYLADRRLGSEVHIRVYEHCLSWFSDHWPADLAWPDGVNRPNRGPARVARAIEKKGADA